MWHQPQATLLRSCLRDGSCCSAVSPCGFFGVWVQLTSLPVVLQEPLLPSFKRSSHNLSAASKMSVSAAEVCFTVTDIIALNFLHGCYQSVTDTLGN